MKTLLSILLLLVVTSGFAFAGDRNFWSPTDVGDRPVTLPIDPSNIPLPGWKPIQKAYYLGIYYTYICEDMSGGTYGSSEELWDYTNDTNNWVYPQYYACNGGDWSWLSDYIKDHRPSVQQIPQARVTRYHTQ